MTDESKVKVQYRLNLKDYLFHFINPGLLLMEMMWWIGFSVIFVFGVNFLFGGFMGLHRYDPELVEGIVLYCCILCLFIFFFTRLPFRSILLGVLKRNMPFKEELLFDGDNVLIKRYNARNGKLVYDKSRSLKFIKDIIETKETICILLVVPHGLRKESIVIPRSKISYKKIVSATGFSRVK